MLQVELIGFLGADCEIKSVDGKEFVAMRVADSSSWTDNEGVKHETTRWVDVTLSKVTEVHKYLKVGTLVFVRGTLATRIYSSEKDRCQKVGITIFAREIQLLSSSKKEDNHEQSNSATKYEGF